MLPWCLPPSFPSIRLTVREQITIEDLKDSWRCCWKIFKKADNFSNSEFLSLRCLPLSLGSIGPMVWEEMSFEEFQDGGHIGHANKMILAILNLCVTVMLPIKFWLNQTYGLGGVSFEEFQDGHHRCHLGYRNGTTSAILNLYIAPMPPIKFWPNLTYDLGGDVVWIISRWPPWWPSWKLQQNYFSNSESL